MSNNPPGDPLFSRAAGKRPRRLTEANLAHLHYQSSGDHQLPSSPEQKRGIPQNHRVMALNSATENGIGMMRNPRAVPLWQSVAGPSRPSLLESTSPNAIGGFEFTTPAGPNCSNSVTTPAGDITGDPGSTSETTRRELLHETAARSSFMTDRPNHNSHGLARPTTQPGNYQDNHIRTIIKHPFKSLILDSGRKLHKRTDSSPSLLASEPLLHNVHGVKRSSTVGSTVMKWIRRNSSNVKENRHPTQGQSTSGQNYDRWSTLIDNVWARTEDPEELLSVEMTFQRPSGLPHRVHMSWMPQCNPPMPLEGPTIPPSSQFFHDGTRVYYGTGFEMIPTPNFQFPPRANPPLRTGNPLIRANGRVAPESPVRSGLGSFEVTRLVNTWNTTIPHNASTGSPVSANSAPQDIPNCYSNKAAHVPPIAARCTTEASSSTRHAHNQGSTVDSDNSAPTTTGEAPSSTRRCMSPNPLAAYLAGPSPPPDFPLPRLPPTKWIQNTIPFTLLVTSKRYIPPVAKSSTIFELRRIFAGDIIQVRTRLYHFTHQQYNLKAGKNELQLVGLHDGQELELLVPTVHEEYPVCLERHYHEMKVIKLENTGQTSLPAGVGYKVVFRLEDTTTLSSFIYTDGSESAYQFRRAKEVGQQRMALGLTDHIMVLYLLSIPEHPGVNYVMGWCIGGGCSLTKVVGTGPARPRNGGFAKDVKVDGFCVKGWIEMQGEGKEGVIDAEERSLKWTGMANDVHSTCTRCEGLK
ncbi:hypothetical protein EX30DRAFT_350561 [Ascodesmis nigricans]|uniref:Uncharacterized protein n=1 Tax=Ascodesmis nigricans TaxID=341454 RepID=A0A4S2MPQ4_9PEZI|nr:hypothetical protein EX30DRAFT_350561 [Ascodesmis nigricans]